MRALLTSMLLSIVPSFVASSGAPSRSLTVELQASVEAHLASLPSHVLAEQAQVVRSLREHAAREQAPVVATLKRVGEHASFEVFWITNSIVVQGGSVHLAAALANTTGVRTVRPSDVAHLPVARRGPTAPAMNRSRLNVEWNIKMVAADKLWEQTGTTGVGVTVGVMDTGARHTHEALRDSFKGGDFAWFDAEGGGRLEPYDDNGHGSHCIGTVAGSHGIGVAPGAKWTACKAFSAAGSGGEADILRCGEWFACPTTSDGSREDCSQAPDVVSNSWGSSSSGLDNYNGMLLVWRALGIVPVFAAGNSGPSCGSITSPSDLAATMSVGSTTMFEDISSFSSKGPPANAAAPFALQKPGISAPGSNVLSATHLSDTSYSSFSGTSMATPHVAGALALALSLDLTAEQRRFEELQRLLQSSADTESLNSPGTDCGGRPEDQFPNYAYGFGRLNACKAARATGAVSPEDCESQGPGPLPCDCTPSCAETCGFFGMSCCCGVEGNCHCQGGNECCAPCAASRANGTKAR